MSQDDATHAAAQDILAAVVGRDPSSVAAEPSRLGGTVVAGAPDDAREGARAEIWAALFGGPTPGAM